ncbi:MAG: NfeD family protein [Candidatus Paceibacterota bacterium]
MEIFNFIESLFSESAPSPYILWGLVIITFIALELMTNDLLFASLALSSFAALLAQYLGFDYVGQGVSFGVAAISTLFILRPIALKHLKQRTPEQNTNVDALINHKAYTLQKVNHLSGQIRLKGEVWSAVTENGSVVEKDRYVLVTKINGATAVIEEITKEKENNNGAA